MTNLEERTETSRSDLAQRLYNNLRASAIAVLNRVASGLNSSERARTYAEYISGVKEELRLGRKPSYE